MIDINEDLSTNFMLQHDGVFDSDEENSLRCVAWSYAQAEGALAVLSCLRTNESYIYFGRAAALLGFDSIDAFQKVDSVWEECIIERIHPDDWKIRNLQELLFYRYSSHLVPLNRVYPWHMENAMRMKDSKGFWHKVLHRIFYFSSEGKNGISYALCVYTLTDSLFEDARMKCSLTGKSKLLKVEECHRILSDREKEVLMLIRNGLASKEIASQLEISKHTVDRHRQNIISKLQVSNATEACHKAQLLGLID